MNKKIIVAATVASTLFSSTVSLATSQSPTEMKFIPFRSDYVKYIANTKDLSDSTVRQYIWLKLFDEELNWNTTASYYSEGYSSWADKYFCNYVGSDGVVNSSKNITVTYNPAFDSSLYSTITGSQDFIINWINKNDVVFKNYCKSASSHPIFAEAIVALTKGFDSKSNYIGGGKDSDTNLFLKGSSAQCDKHSTHSGPKWKADETSYDTYDIDILRVFGSAYGKLNETQKTWVKTYMQWMVDDYIKNGSESVVADSSALYNLIAISGEGFNSAAAQEFFDHCIKSSDVNVGDLIVNAAKSYNQEKSLYTGEADIIANTDMSVIWDLSDGDCYYTDSSWAGYRTPAGQEMDNDYDWLCYEICYGEGEYWSKLRKLVAGNNDTNSQMQNWLLRYNSKGESSGSNKPGTIPYAVAHAGKTVSEVINTATWGGCGRSASGNHDKSFWCAPHGTESSWTKVKPLGVMKIAFDIPTSGLNVDSSVSYKIYDSSTGTVISSVKDASKRTVINLPAKYVWSSTIVIKGSTRYRDGNQGMVGQGGCAQTHRGSTTMNFTFTDLTVCEKNGHSLSWTYNFYDENDEIITSDDNHTIPKYCEAVGICKNCGHKDTYKETSLTRVDNGAAYTYTAPFNHASSNTLGAKSLTVYKGSATAQSVTYSATENNTFLSSSSNLTNLGKTVSTRKVYTGNGNSVQLSTRVQGMVSLKSGAIKAGARKITIKAYGTDNTYQLVSPKYGILESNELIGSNQHVCTFNLEDYSDAQLEGVFVVIDMLAVNENKGGHNIGDVVTCSSTVKVESIIVSY